MNSLGIVARTLISLLIIGGGIVGFLWMGSPQVPTRPPERVGAPAVQTAIAEAHTGGLQFEVDGVVVPFRQIEIAAEVSGRVEFKADNCRKGRAVKEGELLIRIDQSDYELDLQRLQEERKQAEAMIRELQVEIVTADNQIELTTEQLAIDARQLERNLRLSSTAAASQTELDTARRTELETRNALQSLKDNRNLLNQRLVRMESGKALVESNLQKARLALQRTEIRSPMEGIIVEENVEQDGYIQAGNTVITLQDTAALDVTCKLHMRQMHWLWQSQKSVAEASPGQANAGQANADDQSGEPAEVTDPLVLAYDFPETPATVIYRLGPATYQWRGVLNRYDGAGVDSQTRMVPCRVHVDHPLDVSIRDPDPSVPIGGKPPTLMTGMFVKVRIDARPPIPLVRIPQRAIQPGDAVWVVADGKLHRHQLRVATSDADFIVSYQDPNGIQPGDKIVVSPLATPVEGLPVREVTQP